MRRSAAVSFRRSCSPPVLCLCLCLLSPSLAQAAVGLAQPVDHDKWLTVRVEAQDNEDSPGPLAVSSGNYPAPFLLLPPSGVFYLTADWSFVVEDRLQRLLTYVDLSAESVYAPLGVDVLLADMYLALNLRLVSYASQAGGRSEMVPLVQLPEPTGLLLALIPVVALLRRNTFHKLWRQIRQAGRWSIANYQPWIITSPSYH